MATIVFGFLAVGLIPLGDIIIHLSIVSWSISFLLLALVVEFFVAFFGTVADSTFILVLTSEHGSATTLTISIGVTLVLVIVHRASKRRVLGVLAHVVLATTFAWSAH
jgi:hypothetical protein